MSDADRFRAVVWSLSAAPDPGGRRAIVDRAELVVFAAAAAIVFAFSSRT